MPYTRIRKEEEKWIDNYKTSTKPSMRQWKRSRNSTSPPLNYEKQSTKNISGGNNMDAMSIVLAINNLAEVNERIAIALEESNQLTKKIMER